MSYGIFDHPKHIICPWNFPVDGGNTLYLWTAWQGPKGLTDFRWSQQNPSGLSQGVYLQFFVTKTILWLRENRQFVFVKGINTN